MAEQTESQEGQTPEGEASEGQNQEVHQQEQREYSDVERRAMEQGWVPEDQYTGTGKWRSAEEFLDRGELFAKIDELNRRDKAKEQTLKEMQKHIKRVRETEYNRALATLRAQKAQAMQDGDHGLVVEIDEQIADTKTAAAEELQQIDKPVEAQNVPNPAFLAWVNRNPWYQNDRVMQAAANAIGDEVFASGERNPTRILEEVEKRIRKEFPTRFVNPNRGKPGSVEAGGTRGSGGSGKDSFQLTPEETQVMKKFVKAGLMTEKEYIADIKAQRGA